MSWGVLGQRAALRDDMRVLPLVDFLERLWAGEIIGPPVPFRSRQECGGRTPGRIPIPTTIPESGIGTDSDPHKLSGIARAIDIGCRRERQIHVLGRIARGSAEFQQVGGFAQRSSTPR